MGLRWAPVVADLSNVGLREREFVARGRMKGLRYEVFDVASGKVDDSLQIPKGERRGDLYRIQEPIPTFHPNGYQGPGLNLKTGTLRPGYDPRTNGPGQGLDGPQLDDAAPLLPPTGSTGSSSSRSRGRRYSSVPQARSVRQTGSTGAAGRSHRSTTLDRKPASRSVLLPPPPSRRRIRRIDPTGLPRQRPDANRSGFRLPRLHPAGSGSPPKPRRLSLSGAAVPKPISGVAQRTEIVPTRDNTKATRRWKWLRLPRFGKKNR